MTTISPAARHHAADLLHYIDASPSPWHAVANTRDRLLAAGFAELDAVDRWTLVPGGRYVVCKGGSLIAFALGELPLAENGLRLIGAHTDSPGLRVKPHPADDAQGMARVAVEVYGGPILATFSDRDLSLAGRVQLRSSEGINTRLLRIDQPLLRLANLAIHMNREVNEKGLCFHKQNELPLLLSTSTVNLPASQRFRRLLADRLDVAVDDVLTWDLGVFDVQPGAFWGEQQEFIANSQLDNLASCHAALTALLAETTTPATRVVALFDHEEVGSESAVGAGGAFLGDTLSRIAASQSLDTEDQQRMFGRSFFVSADMAHAWHPNYPAAYEPGHRVMVNQGLVIKSNANQRYATDSESAARFMAACTRAGVPCQQYAHRSDLGCGSTIGPIVAARLGIPSVDVGAPMWSMHSIRESAGVADQLAMAQALQAVLAD